MGIDGITCLDLLSFNLSKAIRYILFGHSESCICKRGKFKFHFFEEFLFFGVFALPLGLTILDFMKNNSKKDPSKIPALAYEDTDNQSLNEEENVEHLDEDIDNNEDIEQLDAEIEDEGKDTLDEEGEDEDQAAALIRMIEESVSNLKTIN